MTIANLRAGWTRIPLADVADVVMGQSPPGSTYNHDGDGLPFYQGKAEFGPLFPTARKWCSAPAKIAEPGDVLLSVRAPVGPTNLCRERSAIGRGLAAIRPRDGIPSKYLLYALQASEDELRKHSTGTTFEAVSGSVVRSHLVPLAPSETREAVIQAVERLLARIEKAVETTAAMGPAMDAYRRALLLAAVTGRLWNAGGHIGPEDTVAHPSEAHGGLPGGWTWATWGELGTSQNGRAFPSKEYANSGVKLLRPGNLHASGRLAWTPKNTRYLPANWAERASAFLVAPGELVMNLTAQSLNDDFLGRVCMTGPNDAALLNQRLARLTPKAMSSRYLLWVFKSPLFRHFVRSLNTGSLIQHMFTSQLDEFRIPTPPPAEQEHIADELDRRMSVLQDLERTLLDSQARARVLRKSVLGRALSGQLTSEPLP